MAEHDCYNPAMDKFYRSPYCAYGLVYNANSFNGRLYCNHIYYYEWAHIKRDVGITYEMFEAAAGPLCQYIQKNPTTADKFYESWIAYPNGSIDDMLVTCCQDCPKNNTELYWRILLKAQFLIHRFAYMSRYPMDLGKLTEDNELFFGTKRREELSNLQSCFNQDYQKVPLTGNSNVCYVTETVEYESEDLYKRQNYWKKQHNIKQQSHHSLKLGRYNAQQGKNMPYLICDPYRSKIKRCLKALWLTVIVRNVSRRSCFVLA